MERIHALLQEVQAAILAGDLDRLMSLVEQESPSFESVRSTWQYYLKELRVLTTDLEFVSLEEGGTTGRRVWVRQHFQCEGFEKQVLNMCLDLVELPDGRLLCRLIHQLRPLFGGGSEVNAPPPGLSPASTSKQIQPQVIGEDPGGPEDYVPTVMRRYKFLRTNPYRASALVLANMMSEATARALTATYSTDRTAWLGKLSLFWHKRAKHLLELRRTSPWPQGGLLGSPKQGADETLHFGAETGAIVGMCHSLQAYITAALRLGGFSSTSVWELSLLTRGVSHALTLVCSGDTPILVSNNFMMKNKSLPYHHNQIVYMCNDNTYWTTDGASNLTPSEMEAAVRLSRQISPSFSLPRQVDLRTYAPNAPSERALNVGYLPSETAADLSARVRQAAAQRRLEGHGPVYTHAWYSYQSLWVRWPEAYFLASMKAPLVQSLAREAAGIPSVLSWIEQNLGSASIFHEPDRIMTSEQVIVHRTAGPWDRALLAAVLGALQQLETRCVLTEQSGYLGYKQGGKWRYVDMRHLAEVAAPEDAPLVVFNDKSAYFPQAGRYDFSI